MTAGRSRSRTHESTTVPTASRASSARRIQLTHVHSFHLDDHSLYQDTHRKRGGAEDVDSELEGEDEGENEEPSGTSPGDLERGLSHASTRTDPESGEVGPSGDASEEDSEIYEPETVREDVTGVAVADLEKRETMKSSRSRRSKTRDPNLVSDRNSSALYAVLTGARLHGTDRTIQQIPKTGQRGRSGWQRSWSRRLPLSRLYPHLWLLPHYNRLKENSRLPVSLDK